MSLMDCPNCGEKIAMNCSYPVFRCPHCYQKIMIRLVPIREWEKGEKGEKDKSSGIVPTAQKQNGDKKAIQSSGIDCEHLQTWDDTVFYCNKERKFLHYSQKPCENCKRKEAKTNGSN